MGATGNSTHSIMKNNPESISIVDALVEPWMGVIGRDFAGYRNHCRRVFIFACALAGTDDDNLQKFAIAAAFHDLGIWTDGTFNYLEPSRKLVRSYLESTGKAEWTDEIETMIEESHKVSPYTCNPSWLVEPFRKADWIELTLGALNFGLPRRYIHEIQRRYPNAGYHPMLARLTFKRMKEHPKDPLPMFRW